MKLEMTHHHIKAIQLDGPSRLEGNTLFVGVAEIRSLLGEDSRVRLVKIAATHPGQGARLAPVLDVVEPRAKEASRRSAFPGWTGAPHEAGQGLTHVLSGVAVVAVGALPGAQEGLIDMSPEASLYCPFSKTLNLTLVFEPARGVDRASADDSIRRSLLKTAEFLAGLARGAGPHRTQTWERLPSGGPLRRAALVYLVQSQGDLRRTYLYGHACDDIIPTVLDPLEVLDGAVVSGNFVLPSNKTCTYIHQNHPIITEMMRRHGIEFEFAGVILANEMSRQEDKERSAQFVRKLVRLMGADAVVVNQEGGGNTVTDVMMLCRQLSDSAVKTVLLVNEFAGPDGATPSLTETTPEATAIVSAGNNDHLITLPPAAEFIGLTPFPGAGDDVKGTIMVPLSRVYASTNQLGFNNLSCRTC